MSEKLEASPGRRIRWERDDLGLKSQIIESVTEYWRREDKEKIWKQIEKVPLLRLQDLGTIGGCEVDGLWVAHHISVFVRYKNDFADLMHAFDGIFSESHIKADISYDEAEKFLKLFKQLAAKYKLLDGKRELTPHDEKRLLDALKSENPAVRFFHAVEALARESGKAIASADPMEDKENYAVHRFMDEMIQAWRERGVFGGALVGGVSLMSLGFGYLRGDVTRRTFLKTGAGAGIGAFVSTVSSLSWGANVRNNHGSAERAGGGPLSSFLYNFEDYRDAVGSAGLEQYCRVLSSAALQRGETKKPKVLVVYGQMHQDPINHYNNHPIRRSATIRGYMPTFGSIRRPSLLMHRPIGKGESLLYSHEHRRLEY